MFWQQVRDGSRRRNWHTKKTFVNGALQNMTEQMNCIEVSIFIRSKFNYILINVHKYRETSSFFVYDFNRKCHNQLFLLNYHIWRKIHNTYRISLNSIDIKCIHILICMGFWNVCYIEVYYMYLSFLWFYFHGPLILLFRVLDHLISFVPNHWEPFTQ